MSDVVTDAPEHRPRPDRRSPTSEPIDRDRGPTPPPSPALARPVPPTARSARAAPTDPADLHARRARPRRLPRLHDLRARPLQPGQPARSLEHRRGVPQLPARQRQVAAGQRDDGDRSPRHWRAAGTGPFMLRWNGEWSPPSSGLSEQSIPEELRDRVITENVDARMITEIDGETYEIVGISLEARQRPVLRVLQPRGGQRDAVQRGLVPAPRGDDHDRTRRARRRARRPPCRPSGRRRLRSRQGDRRRPPRDAARPDRRSRSRRARQLVQRHGEPRCSSASSATPASPPTSRTSCARR